MSDKSTKFHKNQPKVSDKPNEHPERSSSTKPISARKGHGCFVKIVQEIRQTADKRVSPTKPCDNTEICDRPVDYWRSKKNLKQNSCLLSQEKERKLSVNTVSVISDSLCNRGVFQKYVCNLNI